MKIAFLIGSVNISGGNYVTFQHACFAKAQGHEVSLIVMRQWQPADLAWHPALAELELLHLPAVGDRSFDLVVATWWRTAMHLDEVSARQYAYFVQSIESRFFDDSKPRWRELVDGTYRLGLPTVTEATWIQQHLAEQFGTSAKLARNGILKSLYTPEGPAITPRPTGRLRVLVEGPFGVAIKNTARTIRLLRNLPGCEVWLLTSSRVPWYPGVSRVFSQVPIHEVPPIYRACDVIVKLSYVEGMFGPPLEMFHCGGTALVYDVSGHDEYIAHDRNAIVVATDDEADVVRSVKRLASDPALVARLKAGAAQTAADWPDWSASSAEFLAHIEAIAREPAVARSHLREQLASLRERYSAELNPAQAAVQPSTGWRGFARNLKRSLKQRVEPYRLLWSYIQEGKR